MFRWKSIKSLFFELVSFGILELWLYLKFFVSIQTRDVPDSRSRGANNTYNRGGRGGSDRYAGRSASTRLSSTGINTISSLGWMGKFYVSVNYRIHAYVLLLFRFWKLSGKIYTQERKWNSGLHKLLVFCLWSAKPPADTTQVFPWVVSFFCSLIVEATEKISGSFVSFILKLN